MEHLVTEKAKRDLVRAVSGHEEARTKIHLAWENVVRTATGVLDNDASDLEEPARLPRKRVIFDSAMQAEDYEFAWSWAEYCEEMARVFDLRSEVDEWGRMAALAIGMPRKSSENDY